MNTGPPLENPSYALGLEWRASEVPNSHQGVPPGHQEDGHLFLAVKSLEAPLPQAPCFPAANLTPTSTPSRQGDQQPQSCPLSCPAGLPKGPQGSLKGKATCAHKQFQEHLELYLHLWGPAQSSPCTPGRVQGFASRACPLPPAVPGRQSGERSS